MQLLSIAGILLGTFITISVIGNNMMKKDEDAKKNFDDFIEEVSEKMDNYVLNKSKELNMKYEKGQSLIVLFVL